jgi:drug/metabolite transporter (DMT)-like permease
VAIALGLAVALAYGIGDFLGGHTSRGNHPLVVVATSQVVSLTLIAVLVVVDGAPLPRAPELGFGAASGVAGLLGVLLLYRGLALGAMGVIAPITAVGAALVPVTYGLLTGERPGAAAYVGMACALVAIALVAGARPASGAASPHHAGTKEVGLAVASGVGFGVALILLSESGSGEGFWPVLAARCASVPLALVALGASRLSRRLVPGTRLPVALAGALDVSAVALYLLATRRGLVSLVAVVGSLYPAVTVLLARVVLGERLVRLQVWGLVLALAGVVLIAR